MFQAIYLGVATILIQGFDHENTYAKIMSYKTCLISDNTYMIKRLFIYSYNICQIIQSIYLLTLHDSSYHVDKGHWPWEDVCKISIFQNVVSVIILTGWCLYLFLSNIILSIYLFALHLTQATMSIKGFDNEKVYAKLKCFKMSCLW